jgi:peptidoglycan/xylan/chitin deacetylase (PgdA/CDA1 family)
MPLRRFACFSILVLLAASGTSSASAEASVSASASPTSPVVPVVYRVKTADPVVFITIDDGFTRTERAKRMLEDIVHSAFVIRGPLNQDPSFWRRSHERGVSFGNHTARHPNLTRLSRRSQQREICAGRDAVKKVVGTTPVLFRPPGGNWNQSTLRAAHACGMTHLVLWDVVVDGSRISTWGPPIRRGDIILLHYRHDLDVSLKVLMKELDRLGLRPADLEKYLAQ